MIKKGFFISLSIASLLLFLSELLVFSTLQTQITAEATSQFAAQKCSDGTVYGKCSTTKPLYCSDGNLIDNCTKCNCPTGQICNSTTNSCYVPLKNCSDGTPSGACSVTLPKYCQNGTLINNCSECGCPTGQECNVTSNQCQPTIVITNCSDGTPYGQCSINKPLYCANGILRDNCTQCGCPTGLVCNQLAEACLLPNLAPIVSSISLTSTRGMNTTRENLSCTATLSDSDGDALNATIRWYENGYLTLTSVYNNLGNWTYLNDILTSGNLSAESTWKCKVMATDGKANSTWEESNSLFVVSPPLQTCSDGTPYGNCSITKPKYCDNGVLIDKCSYCACPLGYECNSTTNSCHVPLKNCSDGTPFGWCSATKPKYCDNGTLIDRCDLCSCPSSEELCNTTSKSCYLEPVCSDGTKYGVCSITKPKYCDNGQLVDKCTQCNCTAGYACNLTSNLCYLPMPQVPPNMPPANPNPIISSADGSNTPASNLICYSILYDENLDMMNVTVNWFKNEKESLTVYHKGNYLNGTTITSILYSGNLSVGDQWICSMRIFDGKNYSSWVNSTILTIVSPTPPPIPQPPSGGGGGGGPLPPPQSAPISTSPACVPKLDVSVPQDVYIPRGVTKEIRVIVTNVGNCSIPNLAAVLEFPEGWRTSSFILNTALGINASQVIVLSVMPPNMALGEYPAVFRLDSPGISLKKNITAWLLDNPPAMVQEQQEQVKLNSQTKTFFYILFLILIEFVVGSIIIMAWLRPKPKFPLETN